MALSPSLGTCFVPSRRYSLTETSLSYGSSVKEGRRRLSRGITVIWSFSGISPGCTHPSIGRAIVVHVQVCLGTEMSHYWTFHT